MDIKELKRRRDSVKARLNALDTEREFLIAEEQALTDLVKVYEQRPYDPIVEEKTVTNKMKPSRKYQSKAEASEEVLAIMQVYTEALPNMKSWS